MQRFLTLLFLVLVSCSPAAAPRPAVDVVVGRWGDLWRLNVQSSEFQRLTTFAPMASAYEPAVAPAGDRLAYTFRPPLPPPVANQPLVVPPPTIYVQSLAGGAGAGLIPDQEEAHAFDHPNWSPDGKLIYATRRTQFVDSQGLGPSLDVVSIDVAQRTWKIVVPNAQASSVTPDGAAIAAIRILTDTITPQVVLLDLTTSQERTLLNDPRFESVEGLLWSTDGQTLYLAATEPPPGTGSPGGLVDFFSPSVAEAHGTGWTIWAMQRDGSNLRQLATTRFEDPRLGLAGPDLLIWAASGLWQLDIAAKTTTMLLEPGDVSGMSRIP